MKITRELPDLGSSRVLYKYSFFDRSRRISAGAVSAQAEASAKRYQSGTVQLSAEGR